jgi:plastocyanin
MRLTPLFAAFMMAALVLPAACVDDVGGDRADPSPSLAPSSADASVTIADMAFSPEDVDISAGDTVAWSFDDGDVPHNVTFEDGGSSSDTQDSGSWSRSFDEAGTYEYRCTLHSQMHGTVTVS